MKIDRIGIYHVAMPLIAPWRTAASDETAIQSVLVHLVAGQSEGWAETAPHSGPNYSPEWAQGAFAVLERILVPLLFESDPETGKDVQAAMASVKGNGFAKAGIDIAFHDLLARRAGLPLWQMLGGKTPEVAVGADIAVEQTIDDLLAKVQDAVDHAMTRVKLKYRPGWDFEMVSAVRAAFPGLRMHIDCNSCYTLDDLDMFKKLDRLELAMIEQPLGHDDILDHAVLRTRIGTPICLDETITSAQRARQAIDHRACDIINLKVGRLGGITPTLEVRAMCEAAGIGNWMGNMLESAVGQGATLAVATLPNMTYPADIFPTTRLYTKDLASEPIDFCGASRMRAPDRPGLGWVPDPERLGAMTINAAELVRS